MKDLFKVKHQRKNMKTALESRKCPCLWTVQVHIAKMSILPQVIYRLNTTAIKMLMSFFKQTEKHLKFIRTQKALNTLPRPVSNKNNSTRAIPVPDFNLYSGSTGTAWHQPRQRPPDTSGPTCAGT